MATELRKVGADVEEGEDFIRIQPLMISQFKHAEIETYNDHRMAMCLCVDCIIGYTCHDFRSQMYG